MFQEIKIKKSLREVIPARHKRSRADGVEMMVQPVKRRLFWTKVGLGILMLAVILAGGVLLLTNLTRAEVVIIPKGFVAGLDKEFSATRAETGQGGLEFDFLVLAEAAASRRIPAIGVKEVSNRASGRIVIYNLYSSAPQRLIAGTRFETADGKIYRIKEAVVVPGMTEKGDEKIPGALEVGVQADQPGDDYNIGLVDFTIPGFKDTPQFEKFYARSKTAMTGGLVGFVKEVNPEAERAARAEIEKELRESLAQPETNRSLEEFIYYPEGVFFRPAEETTFEAKSKDDLTPLELKESGRLVALAFSKKELGRFLVAAAPDLNLPPGEFNVVNLGLLSFRLKDKDSIVPETVNSIVFSLNGDMIVEMEIDQALLLARLVGRSREEAQDILDTMPEIESAKIGLKPFWSRSLPRDQGRIKLIVSPSA